MDQHIKAWQGEGAEGKMKDLANLPKMDQSHRVWEEFRQK